MYRSIISLSIIILTGLISPVFAQNANGDLKTSAELVAFCKIETNNINFGSLISPITIQQTDAELKIMCSNSAPYTIDMAYGGIYGQGATGNGKNYTSLPSSGGETKDFKMYLIYENSVNIGAISCGKATTGFKNTVYFFANQPVASLYGSNITGSYIPDTYNACNNGVINSLTLTNFKGTPASTYGVMTGMSKGDKVAYSFSLPGDNTKVWNKGNNVYSGTGSGENQLITYKAKIVPDSSSSKYPAPDMYSDTVTATINY